MAGRGAQTFKKRQKEQQRKEKQQEKFAKRLERKRLGPAPEDDTENPFEMGDQLDRLDRLALPLEPAEAPEQPLAREQSRTAERP